MFGSFRFVGCCRRWALLLAMMVGGCVYPAYPGYGYYNGGYYGGGPYYGGGVGVVAFDGGWRDHGW